MGHSQRNQRLQQESGVSFRPRALPGTRAAGVNANNQLSLLRKKRNTELRGGTELRRVKKKNLLNLRNL
jgi:hypothetical protein